MECHFNFPSSSEGDLSILVGSKPCKANSIWGTFRLQKVEHLGCLGEFNIANWKAGPIDDSNLPITLYLLFQSHLKGLRYPPHILNLLASSGWAESLSRLQRYAQHVAPRVWDVECHFGAWHPQPGRNLPRVEMVTDWAALCLKKGWKMMRQIALGVGSPAKYRKGRVFIG